MIQLLKQVHKCRKHFNEFLSYEIYENKKFGAIKHNEKTSHFLIVILIVITLNIKKNCMRVAIKNARVLCVDL